MIEANKRELFASESDQDIFHTYLLIYLVEEFQGVLSIPDRRTNLTLHRGL
jgi:hypothetical protein